MHYTYTKITQWYKFNWDANKFPEVRNTLSSQTVDPTIYLDTW
jgi:hypothetical protein